MIVGVLQETFPGERRVALVPSVLPSLKKGGIDVLIEPKAGEQAGYPDAAFAEKGAKIAASRAQVLQEADCIVQVRLLGANLREGQRDLAGLRKGQMMIGMAEALSAPQSVQELASREVTAFALELMPRIRRAQSMAFLRM